MNRGLKRVDLRIISLGSAFAWFRSSIFSELAGQFNDTLLLPTDPSLQIGDLMPHGDCP